MFETPPRTPAPRAGRAALAVALAGGLAVGGAVAAHAATTEPSPAGTTTATGTLPAPPPGPRDPSGNPAYDADGRITAATGSSVTVRDLFGRARTYTLTSATLIHQGPQQRLSASALAPGLHVHVAGRSTGTTLSAVDIDVHPAHVDGVVTAIGGSTLTITDPDGFTRRIATTSNTRYTRAGAAATGVVRVGSVVHAIGRVDPDGTTLDATAMDLPVAPARGPGAPPAPQPPATSGAPRSSAPSGAPQPPTATPSVNGS